MAYQFFSWLSLAVITDRVREEITIEGNVKGLPNGWIWLTPADRWKVHLDSALCKNGHFVFRIDTASLLNPLKASLRYRDETQPGSVRAISFLNHIIKTAGNTRLPDAFYLEKLPIQIGGEINNGCWIHAGRETDIFFKHQFEDFGWLDFPDTIKRKQRLKFFQSEIRVDSQSYFLMESLFKFKEQYSKQEFKDLLSLFSPDLKNSKLADSINAYLLSRPDIGKPYQPINFTTVNGSLEKFPDSLRPLNMVVFWASWCGPCRRELPVLKSIFSRYQGKAFQIISISIDSDDQEWMGALAAEKLQWKQLIVDENQLVWVQQAYNFATIPFTVFLDKEGKEIQRFSGYDPESGEIYRRFIEARLAGKN